MMKKKLIGLLIAIFILLNIFMINTSAANESYFNVRAEIPENQINQNNSYFDLLVEPGQEQTLIVTVNNTSNEPIEVTVDVNNAATNTNGTIMYTTHGIKDESMKVSIEDIARVEENQFVLAAHESKAVEIKLNLPEQEFKVTILGGVVVQAIPESHKNTEDQEDGIQIQNRLTYVVGLQLRQDLETEVQPNMNYLGTEAIQHDISSAVGIHLQNSEAVIMKNVQVDAEIYKSNSQTILHEYHNGVVEIAPNSAFDVAVVWGNEKLQPGTYRLKLRIQFEEHIWEWDEEFVIEAEDADNSNEGAINIDHSLPNWIYYVIGGLSLLILLFLVFLLGRRSKEKENKRK